MRILRGLYTCETAREPRLVTITDLTKTDARTQRRYIEILIAIPMPEYLSSYR